MKTKRHEHEPDAKAGSEPQLEQDELPPYDPLGIGDMLVPKTPRLPEVGGRIAGMVRGALHPRWRRVMLRDDAALAEESLQQLFPDLAGLEQKLGRTLLDALICGNREFPREVSKALLEMDELFDRKRVKEEVNRLVLIWPELKKCANKAEAREMAEKHLGRKLLNEIWNRVQKYFELDNLPSAKRGPKKCRSN